MTVATSARTPSTNTRSRIALDAAAQAAVVAALWSIYAAVRHLTGDRRGSALDNAVRLLEVESVLGVDVEAAVQSAVDWPHVFVAANAYYLIHFPITLAALVLAFGLERTRVYSVLRDSLVGSTVVALLLHLVVPMAPPRMLPGFVDAGSTFGPDPYSIAGSESANQFAAMPSLHVAWAVLVGCALWRLSTWRIARCVAATHPLITSLVVVLTGHHFVTDVAVGAVLAVTVVTAASRYRSRRPKRASTSRPATPHPATPHPAAMGSAATAHEAGRQRSCQNREQSNPPMTPSLNGPRNGCAVPVRAMFSGDSANRSRISPRSSPAANRPTQ